MKPFGLGVLALVFAAGSFAQQSAPKQQAQTASRPATSSSTPYSITNKAFASSLGAAVAGRGGSGHAQKYHSQPVVVVPYAYPVYMGGYGYDTGSAPAPDPAPTPDAVINQNFVPEHATPVIQEYGDNTSADGIRVYDAPGRAPVDSSADDDVDYYLIAFKDHSIYSAFAYWVEGETLHYVTAQRVHNQASLSLVDRELTAKLNRNHKIQVTLPN